VSSFFDWIDEKLRSPSKQRLLSKQIHKAHTMQSKGAKQQISMYKNNKVIEHQCKEK
jgi:hypothetical protein